MTRAQFDVETLAKKHEEEFEIFRSTTKDVDLMVLKGHQLVERFLTSLIESYCWKPQFLIDANLSFFSKVKLARCLVMHPMPGDSIWDNIETLNRLRNELVHTWESKKREHLTRRFLAYRLETHEKTDPNRADLSTKEKCAEEVASSISWLIGQLTVIDIVISFMESQRTYGQQKNHVAP
jgi:hypothetical protein